MEALGPVRVTCVSSLENHSDCPLCRLFAALCAGFPRRSYHGQDPDMFLWARSTGHYFARWVEPNAEVDDTVLLSVAPVPWVPFIDLALPVSGQSQQFYGRSRADQIDWSVVQNWVDSCDRQHDCSVRKPRIAAMTPSLAIDCVERQLVQLSPSSRYVALSYIWRNPAAEYNTAPSSTCLPSVLPRTIEDAIKVTTQLDFRYLWIDRYCIPQHNSQEKHRLINQMGHIYANAAVH